jgi:Tfp pilus assembly protein PilF/4-amino-4-deoxy-L-arabinose transferase-like glycosyltransferase
VNAGFKNSDSSPRPHLLIGILGCALALRLVYVYLIRETPLGEVLLIDSDFYQREALRIVGGDWWEGRPFFMNPFYPYFLAVIYVLGGVHIWLGGIVQALLGTASCYWVYCIGKQLWGEWEGLSATALMALCGVLVFYDGSLLTASPILFLNLSALVALLQWQQTRRLRWLFFAGLLLGGSALARPMVLLFAVCIAWWIYRVEKGRLLLRVGCVWLGIALALFPVVLRNYVVGGQWGLPTSALGMNFYVGNHPEATGIYAQVDFLDSAEPDRERDEFIREAQRRSGQMLSGAEASRFWLVQGLTYIYSQPFDYALLLGRKLYMFANRVESQNNLSFYFARDFAPLLHVAVVGWWLLAPLAAGAWCCAGTRRDALLDLYFASYLLACLAFFVSSEYRLPVVPVLALYSGRFIVECFAWFKRGVPRAVLKRLLLVAFFAVPVNYADALASRLTLRRVDYYNFGVLYERRGEAQRAAQMFSRSLTIDAEFEPAQLGLARVQKSQRQRDAPLQDDRVNALVAAALEAYAERRYESAQELLERAIAIDPQHPQAYNNLGLVHYKMGQMAAAMHAYHQALSLDAGYAKAQYNLGLAQMAIKDYAAADSSFGKALLIDPQYRQALYKRGQLAAQLGRGELALKYWGELLQLVGEDATLRAQMDSLLGRP